MTRDVFRDLQGAPGRRMSALALQLQQAIVIAHDPVVGDGALLLQAKHVGRVGRWRGPGFE